MLPAIRYRPTLAITGSNYVTALASIQLLGAVEWAAARTSARRRRSLGAYKGLFGRKIGKIVSQLARSDGVSFTAGIADEEHGLLEMFRRNP